MNENDNIPKLRVVYSNPEELTDGNLASIAQRELLLASFLGEVGAAHSKDMAVLSHDLQPKELSEITTFDYPEIEITDEVEQKIKALQKIVADIENKPALQLNTAQLDKPYKINYLKSLNPSQLAATVTINGPMLVIAGAGSGKTRVIIHRLAYLIENGVNPQDILLLTFTRKSAKEMLSRAQELLQDKMVEKVNGGTFHSFANHVLRANCNFIGVNPNFTIIDTADSEDTVDLIRTELQFEKTDKAFPRKARIYEIISSSRNRNKTIAEIITNEFSGLQNYIKEIELLALGYAQYKKICAIFDYDDLMEVLRNALRDISIFRQKLQKDYRFIMVDEFQDTNVVQKEIVDFLAGAHRNLMVVGDDSQSIYSFRGANYENILRFPETYPDCMVVKIEQNYRSNQTLLNFTNAIISSAKIGYKKKLFSANTNLFRPVVRKFYDQETEAEYIVSRILELRERGIELKEMAVLNRAAWHWHHIELELRKRGIPYITVGGLSFHEKMHIKDILAYLRIVLNPYDAVAWHRILKLLTGVGKVTAAGIIKDIRQNQGSLNLSGYAKKKFFNEISELMLALQSASRQDIGTAAKTEIIKNYYAPILKSRESDYSVRLLDIEVLCSMAAKYDNLEKFLSEFALDPPSKRFSGQTTPLIEEGEEKPLTLSTVHSAKGLEWYCVFVPHCLDGLFPSSRATHNLEELEEERRLFYVACSRAKEELYITMPSYVRTFSGFCSYPSRFLIEISKDTFEYQK